MNYAYRLTQQALHLEYQGALVDSGANGGMAGSDTRILATIPHAFVDITGVGGKVLQRLPIVQGASLIHMIDEGPIILIMSQYAHKPDSKSIHSKSQIEHFGGVVHDSAKSTGGQQLVVTHEGYTIPLHVRNGLYYMDMVPPTDDDMERYPHVFITADSPWNPDSLNEEFFLMQLMPSWTFPGSNSNVIHVKRLICSGFPPRLPLHHSTHRLLKPDSLLFCIHYPLCLKRSVIAFLTSMLSCLILVGWGKTAAMTPLKKPPNIIRLTSVSRCASTFDPISPLLMYDASRNGTQLIPSFLTFPLMTTGFLDMADAILSRSMGVWTRSSLLVIQCPRRPNCPQPCKNSSVTMEQWRVLSPTTRNRRPPSR